MNFPHPQLNQQFSSMEPLKGIFSVFGSFGVGKTTFAIQTALHSIQSGQTVLYFYSKPHLPLQRIKKIYKGMKGKFPESTMNSLTFIPIGSFEKLLEFSFNLEFLYLNESGAFNPKNNMVIFDSITDLYKMKLDPKNKNHNVALNHQLNQILANLYHLNKKYGIELLLVNELSRNQEGEPILSGGKVMGYWVAYSLQIRRTPALNKRVALLSLPKRASPLTFELTIAEKGFSPIP